MDLAIKDGGDYNYNDDDSDGDLDLVIIWYQWWLKVTFWGILTTD